MGCDLTRSLASRLAIVPALLVGTCAADVAVTYASQGPHEDLWSYALRRVRETDVGGEELKGFRAIVGAVDESNDLIPLQGGFWLDFRDGDEQRVIGTGLEVACVMPLGPTRFGSRWQLGLEHRNEAPHSGIGGLFGIGAELDVWMGRRVQVGVTADRIFGFPSGTRDQVGVSLRIAHDLPWARLRNAVSAGNTERVRRIVRTQDPSGSEIRLAMYEAIERCDAVMTDLLLELAPDPDELARDPSFASRATMCEDGSVLSTLVDHGADPDRQFGFGTVLLVAVEKDDAEAVRRLLAVGASPDLEADRAWGAEACEGRPLILAAGRGSREIVSMLLAHGADPDLADRFGCTAAEAARANGHDEILELLGATPD